MQEVLRLRPARMDDLDGFHDLASIPPIYRYLFDGAPPERAFIAERLARSVAQAADGSFGVWFLQDGPCRHVGCVELRPYPAPRAAEIAWLLHPSRWGRGLALRMAWTAIVGAFAAGRIDAVIAGADQPNTASLALMRRLGMRFRRRVAYPLGPGVEYILYRADAGPLPRPDPIACG